MILEVSTEPSESNCLFPDQTTPPKKLPPGDLTFWGSMHSLCLCTCRPETGWGHTLLCFLHQENTLFLSVSVRLQPPADLQAAGASVRPANCSSLHSPAGAGVTQSLIIRGLEWKAARLCSSTACKETSDLQHIQSTCVEFDLQAADLFTSYHETNKRRKERDVFLSRS